MSLKHIVLMREDLVKFKQDLPVDEITFYDFKSSSLDRNEILTAHLILFVDTQTNTIKELKNRFW